MVASLPTKLASNVKAIASIMMTVLQSNTYPNTLPKPNRNTHKKEEYDLLESVAYLQDLTTTPVLISTTPTLPDLSPNGKPKVVEETLSRFLNSWRNITKKDSATRMG